jgi:hypothetical protein
VKLHETGELTVSRQRRHFDSRQRERLKRTKIVSVMSLETPFCLSVGRLVCVLVIYLNLDVAFFQHDSTR